MRISLFLLSLLLSVWLPINTAYCQTATDTINTAQPNPVYRFAVGVRKSVNGDDEISFSGKYFLTQKAVLHMTVGQLYGPGCAAVSISYERYHSLFHSARFQYTYGIGVSTLIFDGNVESIFRSDSRVRLYGNAIVGLNYTCRSLPLAMSIDGRVLARGFRTSNWSRESSQNLALSVHYLIK